MKIANNKKFYILHFTFYILIIITLLSCTTSPQTGSLSGNIQLENESDHSGITIALYDLAELDPDIVEANTKWPHIGVIINQMTEFDHRFANLLKSTQTDANGNFKIKDIPTGRYNFMAMKEGFGFKYIYEILINEGENALSEQCKMKNVRCKMKNNEKKSNSDNFTFLTLNFTLDSNDSTRNTADIILYPATHIHEDITETTIFESSHHYIIENDIYVSGVLTIEHGAVIRIEK
ncbi:MAG: hypothetical protein U9R23_03070, partial [Candidatus Cloacimonadota bacterium]|nr:hypothetical protein [Candidatus Cloacimonadota bacterium]